MSNDTGSPGQTVFAVDKLISYMGDDQAGRTIIAKIVTDAIAPGTAPLDLAALALREQRVEDAARILHGLRGSIGSLGCQRFVTASLAVELAMAQQRLADVPALFEQVEAEYRLALQQAAAWLQQHHTGAA